MSVRAAGGPWGVRSRGPNPAHTSGTAGRRAVGRARHRAVLALHRARLQGVAVSQRVVAPAFGASVELRDERGHTVVHRLGLRVARFSTTGFLSDELARFALAANGAMLDELLARGEEPAFRGLYDWGAMTGYSPGARTASTEFVVARRRQLASVQILTGSALVAMGVNVANIVVSGFLQATTVRAEFERWVEQATRP